MPETMTLTGSARIDNRYTVAGHTVDYQATCSQPNEIDHQPLTI
jgi:hypothetical protein